jgi:hypothetical protein
VNLRYRPLLVLVVSGALGFRLGMVAYPSWQVAVETAQVVAGLVTYPPGNPFYIYHTKLWTILHQISALLLLAGVSEITLSKVLSGVLGMLSLQALSMCVFALCRNALLAIGASLFILATRSASNGETYPILLMATEHTYGVAGLSTFVLGVAAVASGCYGLGGFLIGVMPSVHPALGLWLWILVALCVAWDFRNARHELRPGLKWFLAGAAVTTLSLIVQLTVTYDVPRVDPVERDKYFDAFVAFWDGHRPPVGLGVLAVALNRIALALGFIWLVGFRDRLPKGAAFLLRMTILAALVGVATAYASWIPPEKIPTALLTLMPSRILNFNAMIIVALLIGLVGIYQEYLLGRLLLAAMLVSLLFSGRSMFWEWSLMAAPRWLTRALEPIFVLEMTAIGLVCLAAADWVRRRRDAGAMAAGPATRLTKLTLSAASVAAILLTAFLTLRLHPDVTGYFRDRTNDEFFATIAAEREGLVLTAGTYSNVQLFTRRPVLLAGALDTMAYAPESGPAMQRILLDVYGADLLNPPDGAWRKSVLPRAIHRDLWERNSRQRRQEIRRAWDVRVILTPVDWVLDLPLVAEQRFRLYRIPD